jgi:hypothetical protein
MQRNTVTDSDVEVRDYLAPLSDAERARRYRRKQHALKVGCEHPRLRQFTFLDGKTIKMCPDCATFDARRHRALCNGQALKTCTTIESPISNDDFARVNRDKFISFDGKYEGPISNIDDRPLKLRFNKTPNIRGMAHIISWQPDDVVLEEFCYFQQRIERLTYKENPEQSYDLRTGELFLRKPRPKAPKPIPVVREEAQRKVKPAQQVVKAAVEWVVVPLSCTRVVKDIPDYVTLLDHHRLTSLWEGARHTPERTTGSDLRSTPSGPACMWLWSGFRDKTLAKKIGTLHTIGGRWCKCSECCEQRRTQVQL